MLAESRLLDGREATTTWWLAPLFRERYARVRLSPHRAVVAAGRLLTAGASFAHPDLMLALIARTAGPSHLARPIELADLPRACTSCITRSVHSWRCAGRRPRRPRELAGHANLSTTLRYMHLSPAARASAIELLNARPLEDEIGDILEKGARTNAKA